MSKVSENLGDLAQQAMEILVDEGYVSICELHEVPYTEHSEIHEEEARKFAPQLGANTQAALKIFNRVLQDTAMDCGWCEKNAASN